MVYWSIEPPVADRLELALAQLMALTANIHRDAKKTDPFKAEDFMPKWLRAPEPEPADDEDGMAPERIAAVMGRLMAQQEQRDRIMRRR